MTRRTEYLERFELINIEHDNIRKELAEQKFLIEEKQLEALKKLEEKIDKQNELKEQNNEHFIQKLRQDSEELLEKLQRNSKELADSILFRVHDCETLVKSRITESYVKDLGKQIKA